MSYFTGEILQAPPLRFNYSSASALSLNPRQGLRIYGPYDSSIFGKDKITFAVICPSALRQEGNTLVNGLTKGSGGFSGFQHLFRIPLELVNSKVIQHETEQDIRRAAQSLANENLDLVFILVSTRNEMPSRVVCKDEE